MSRNNHDIKLSKDEIDALYSFFLTLNGKKPRILNEY